MSAAPQRIQLQRTKGWRKPPSAVVVARPSKWGNPIPTSGAVQVGITGLDGLHYELMIPLTPAIAVAMYRAELESGLTPMPDDVRLPSGWREEDAEHVAKNRAALAELTGHDLACWCPLDQPCHADVLLELANGGRR